MAAAPAAFRKSRREVVMMPDYTFRFTIGSRQEPQRHLLTIRTGPLGPAGTRFSDGHKQAWLLPDRAECVAGSRSGVDMARSCLSSALPLRSATQQARRHRPDLR